MKADMENIEWGGSGIEKVVFDFILKHIAINDTVVELGAGLVSTAAFSLHFDTHSVEHDDAYIGLFPSVKYIHAPVVDGWYDAEVLSTLLPRKKDQRLIFIDGVCRDGILKHMHLFNPDALYVIHDTYRSKEQQLAQDLAKRLNRKCSFHTDGDYWASI